MLAYLSQHPINESMDLGLESFVLKSGDSLAQGSIYEIVINEDNHRMVMSEKITEVAAPTKVSYELNNDVLNRNLHFYLKEILPRLR